MHFSRGLAGIFRKAERQSEAGSRAKVAVQANHRGGTGGPGDTTRREGRSMRTDTPGAHLQPRIPHKPLPEQRTFVAEVKSLIRCGSTAEMVCFTTTTELICSSRARLQAAAEHPLSPRNLDAHRSKLGRKN